MANVSLDFSYFNTLVINYKVVRSFIVTLGIQAVLERGYKHLGAPIGERGHVPKMRKGALT